jgi:hypothetical protein
MLVEHVSYDMLSYIDPFLFLELFPYLLQTFVCPSQDTHWITFWMNKSLYRLSKSSLQSSGLFSSPTFFSYSSLEGFFL